MGALIDELADGLAANQPKKPVTELRIAQLTENLRARKVEADKAFRHHQNLQGQAHHALVASETADFARLEAQRALVDAIEATAS